MRWLFLRLGVFAVAVWVIAATGRPPAPALSQLEGPLLPSAGFIRLVLPGHAELAADIYWLQLTNAVGRATYAEEYRRAFDYADLITDLAPRFLETYQFAAAVIPFNRGRDTWVNGDESLKILRKGLAQFPDDLTLKLYLVFDLMYLERDYRAAANELKALAALPGAPPHFAQLATRLYAQAGEFDTGLELARALAAGAASDEQRQFFEHRARQIEAEQVLAQVDEAAWAYFRREGKQPTSVVDLLSKGDLATPPVDPLGGEIVIDGFGRARSTVEKFRLELYEDSSKALAKDTD